MAVCWTWFHYENSVTPYYRHTKRPSKTKFVVDFDSKSEKLDGLATFVANYSFLNWFDVKLYALSWLVLGRLTTECVKVHYIGSQIIANIKTNICNMFSWNVNNVVIEIRCSNRPTPDPVEYIKRASIKCGMRARARRNKVTDQKSTLVDTTLLYLTLRTWRFHHPFCFKLFPSLSILYPIRKGKRGNTWRKTDVRRPHSIKKENSSLVHWLK